MKKLFLFAALFVAAAFSACEHDDNEDNDAETPVLPEKQPLAITFAEGNSLQFDLGETKTVHYTITGGSDNNVVKAEMQNLDGAYTLSITPTSATQGTIEITAKEPTTNNVIVSVSDGTQTIMSAIAVSIKPDPQELAIAFAEGNSLQFSGNETKTIHYTITGGSNNAVVTAEMQTSDGAYTVETTPISATQGTITITANTPEADNCIVVTVSDGLQTVTAEIAVSTNPVPKELAIAFTEGNSLQFSGNETKTIHYTITGGSENTVVKAEMQYHDNAYTVETTPTSAAQGTITITATIPTDNRVIVTVSDGSQTVTAEIDVALKAFDGKTVVVITPGTLSQLLADYNKSAITELIVIGNLNTEDIATLKNLPNLAVLDMEHVNLEELPHQAFYQKTSLTSVKLPLSLKKIEIAAFSGCSSLKSITIGNSLTEIGQNAFYGCSSLPNITIPDSVTTIWGYAFYGCSSLCCIEIPEGVTSIQTATFFGCSSMTNIVIPESVTSIHCSVFGNCSSLEWILCSAITPPTIIGSGFYSSIQSVTLYIPIGSKAAYAAADEWKYFSNIYEI